MNIPDTWDTLMPDAGVPGSRGGAGGKGAEQFPISLTAEEGLSDELLFIV